MAEPTTLQVSLNDTAVATLVRFSDDRNYFGFEASYIAQSQRPTLSLSFKNQLGELITKPQSTQTRLPAFFSNLLPEGRLRKYLAQRAGVNPQREFFLLWMLGDDLPGAVSISPRWEFQSDMSAGGHDSDSDDAKLLRFSLAGVQLKFSAVQDAHGGLTIPVQGSGGDWIVKLPDSQYAGVPENEYAMLELARMVGINVPETKLVPIDQIQGVPEETVHLGTHAFAIKRFDRDQGRSIHMEDFAQIFGIYPEHKYEKANCENLAEVISVEVGQTGVVEFVRRLVLNILIGNGDMHLKNWSLIYPDAVHAELAPAYDFVSTIPYIASDKLALNLGSSKIFNQMERVRFQRLADRAMTPRALVDDTVKDTVERFARVWTEDVPLNAGLRATLNDHLPSIPLWRDHVKGRSQTGL